MAERQLRFHPLASDEIEAARAWYAERDPRAAQLFLDDLDVAVARVLENPEGWPRIRKSVHRYVFPKFPFSLVYRFTTLSVEVVAVAHHRRRPGYWRGR